MDWKDKIGGASRCHMVGAMVLGASLVVSCASRGLLSSEKPDRSTWTPYTIELSDWTLKFDVPGGQVVEPWGGRLWIRTVDLDRHKKLLEGNAVRVFEAYWEYEGGVLDGLLGSIQLDIFVVSRFEGYYQNLLSTDDLESYSRIRNSQVWDPANEQHRRRGEHRLLVNIPQIYDRVTLHEHQWLRFKFGGHLDLYGYVIGLRDDRYVEVQFSFADNGKKRPDWRIDAERLREEIAATLRLEQKPKSPL